MLSLGLRARRLRGEEIARLLQSCLAPEQRGNTPSSASTWLLWVMCRVWRDLPSFQMQDRHKNLTGPMQAAGQEVSDESRQPRASARARRCRLLISCAWRIFLRLPALKSFPRPCVWGNIDWVRGIAVTAFPREVAPGWLAPLLMHDDILDIVMHLSSPGASGDHAPVEAQTRGLCIYSVL